MAQPPPGQRPRGRRRRAASAATTPAPALLALLVVLAPLALVRAWIRPPSPPPTMARSTPTLSALARRAAFTDEASGASASASDDGAGSSTGRGRGRKRILGGGEAEAAKPAAGSSSTSRTGTGTGTGRGRKPRAAAAAELSGEPPAGGEGQSAPPAPRTRRRRVADAGDAAAEAEAPDLAPPPPPPPPPVRAPPSRPAGAAPLEQGGGGGGAAGRRRGPAAGGDATGGSSWGASGGGDGAGSMPRRPRPQGTGYQNNNRGGPQQGRGGGPRYRGGGGGNGGGGGGGGGGAGVWLSHAHHRGEDARERLITSQLKNAGNAGGVPALLAKVEETLEELNSVHCTMVINRLSKAPQPERELALGSPAFGDLMKRALRVLPTFTTRDTAQAAISLARFKDVRRVGRWQGLIHALQDKAREGMPDMSPKEMAMVINAFANLPDPPGPAYWDEFSRWFLPKAEQFDKQGLSMVINGMAKMLYRPSAAVLAAVERLTLARMETCNTQELANILNGFGKLDHVPAPEYLAAFERISRPKLGDFQPQELSMTFNAMSRIGYRPSDDYLRAFEAAVIAALPHFKTQESAMTINAFTKMADYAPSREFFEGVERCVVKKAALHRAQEVANTIHGLGRLGYNPSPAFLEAFTQHAMAVMDKMKTQELGNLINGLSKMTSYRPAPAFFNRFMDVSQPLLPSFTTQEVSNAVNGLMRLGCKPDEEYLRATVQVAAGNLGEYKDQELACLFHAYGRMLFFPGVGFMEAYEAEFGRRVKDINSQALAMTLNAFNRLNWKPSPTLLLEMEKSLERATCAGLIFGAELAQAVNGLANLNHTPGRSFLAAFKAVILEQKTFVDLSTIAVILWSLSALDPPRMKGFYTEMVEVACRRLEGEQPDALPASFKGERSSMYYSSLNEVVPTVGDESLEPPMVMCVRQLLQTCRYLSTLANPIDAGLYARLAALLADKWAELQREKYEPHTSYFHRDVLGVVQKSLGLRCDIEVEDEAYTLDMVIYPDDGGLPIVVEADGPHHFFRNVPDEAMGFTVFKHRLLEARSNRWRAVVSVPQAEWLRAREADPRRGRTALLVRKLRDAGLALPHVPDDQLDPS